MAGKKGQKKRFCSNDEKRSICGQKKKGPLCMNPLGASLRNTQPGKGWLVHPASSDQIMLGL